MWEETDIRNKKIVYETYCQDNIYPKIPVKL